MEVLPGAVQQVESPDIFTVSLLSLGKACPLALALASAADISPLPVHPRAIYGRLLHRLLEHAVEQPADVKVTGTDLRKKLDELIAACREAKLHGIPSDVPPPEQVFSPVEWRRRTRDATALALEVGGKERLSITTSSPSQATESPPLFSGKGKWTELPLRSPRLRVRGRADLVRRLEDEVRIIDLKTGRAVLSDGRVSPGVALQLRTYGLVVLEKLPNVRLQLCVRGHSSAEVPFDESDRRDTLETIRELHDKLPQGCSIKTEPVAAPGRVCNYCRFRHRCSIYLEVAPRWWRDGVSHPVPPDVWGTVCAIPRRSRRLVTIDLKDAAGRYVRLHDVRSELVSGVKVGVEIYAFGIGSVEKKGYGEIRYAPVNYQDAEPNGKSGAWTLGIFRAD